MLGEDIYNAIIHKAFPDWTIKHNPFSKRNLLSSRYRYACSHGVDSTATKDGFEPIYSEVKFLKQQPKPYGTDFVEKHVLPRLKGLFGVKVLAITYLNLLTRKAQALLKQHHIITFEFGERFTTDIFNNYSLIIKLAQQLKTTVKPTPRFIITKSYPLIDSYLKPLAVDNQSKKEKQLHDTVKGDKELLEQLSRPFKPSWERLLYIKYVNDIGGFGVD
jgi:hypothetical protein